MEKAREIANEHSENLDDSIRSDKKASTHHEDLKKEINNLIWMYSPESMSMKDAEVCAMTVFDIITDPTCILPYNNLTNKE